MSLAVNKFIMIHLEVVKDLVDDCIHNNRLKTVEHLRNNLFHNKFENVYGNKNLSVSGIKALNKKYINKPTKPFVSLDFPPKYLHKYHLSCHELPQNHFLKRG